MFRYHRAGVTLLVLVFVFTMGAVASNHVSFTDITGHWAKERIERLANQGVIGGYADKTFRPDNPITRAEAVTVIDRLLEALNARLIRLEGQTASQGSGVVIDESLAVKVEQIAPNATEDLLEVDVQTFVRNTGDGTMAFDPSQVVLIMKNANGETLGTILPQSDAEAIRIGAGEGRQVKSLFQIKGEQLAKEEVASLTVGVVDGQGQVQALGINITLDCSWPPLRCRLTITIEL